VRIHDRPAAAAPAHRAPARLVEPTKTPVSKEQLRGAIRRGLEAVTGHAPSAKLVDVLTAHASLETASGARMYNFNFGGIKGASPSGQTAVCRTHEVLDGRDVVIKDGFRAYTTLDEGALDYVRTMKERFAGALEPASRGDVAAFAASLKRAGYYTASEADYARGLASLMGTTSAPGHAGATSVEARVVARVEAPRAHAGLTAAELSRVDAALDQSRWLDALPAAPRARRAHEEEEES